MEHVFFILIGAFPFVVLGEVIARANHRRPRCRAWYTRHMESSVVVSSVQCREDRYPHCDSGFCIIHCREENRCGGACVNARHQLLLEAGR